MTTRDLESRFTSLEAFQFCEFIRSTVSEEQLLLSPPLRNANFTRITPEIPWDSVDPDSIAALSSYRTSSAKLSTRILRWIASFEAGRLSIQSIRRWLLYRPPKGRDFASGTLQ